MRYSFFPASLSKIRFPVHLIVCIKPRYSLQNSVGECINVLVAGSIVLSLLFFSHQFSFSFICQLINLLKSEQFPGSRFQCWLMLCARCCSTQISCLFTTIATHILSPARYCQELYSRAPFCRLISVSQH